MPSIRSYFIVIGWIFANIDYIFAVWNRKNIFQKKERVEKEAPKVYNIEIISFLILHIQYNEFTDINQIGLTQKRFRFQLWSKCAIDITSKWTTKYETIKFCKRLLQSAQCRAQVQASTLSDSIIPKRELIKTQIYFYFSFFISVYLPNFKNSLFFSIDSLHSGWNFHLNLTKKENRISNNHKILKIILQILDETFVYNSFNFVSFFCFKLATSHLKSH